MLSAHPARFAKAICATSEPSIRDDVALHGKLVIEQAVYLLVS